MALGKFGLGLLLKKYCDEAGIAIEPDKIIYKNHNYLETAQVVTQGGDIVVAKYSPFPGELDVHEL
jgi:hypothetical protein